VPENRLGVYIDSLHATIERDHRKQVGVVEGDAPFLIFVAEVGRRFDRTLVFGRHAGTQSQGFVPLPDGLELLPLPSYSNLRDVRNVLRAGLGTARAFWTGLDDVDTVWCFGPHPYGVLLALFAVARRKRVVLGVRQDPIRYFAIRSKSSLWSRAAARVLASSFWILSRRLSITVVGESLAAQYRGADVLDMRVALTRAADVATEPRHRATEEPAVCLLTVGRIAAEKNPELLLRAIAALNDAAGLRFLLTWAGTGELADEVARLANDLELGDLVTFAGHIPFGPELGATYRRADIFVHVALTEGVPQVLLEAFAAGLPVVATDVGGIRASAGDGSAALLVPPADLDALVGAIRELADHPETAERLARAGLALARAHTLEVEAARAAQFLRGT
jgi:glycosyltransferase involved in cell wall biosynthesis